MTDFETVCQANRARIHSLPVTEQYKQTIEYQGRTYHYDRDYDCFYPDIEAEQLSLWDRYGWIVVIVALTGLSIITA
jgi:hypothetical protein